MKLFQTSHGFIISFGFNMVLRRREPGFICWNDPSTQNWRANATNMAGCITSSARRWFGRSKFSPPTKKDRRMSKRRPNSQDRALANVLRGLLLAGTPSMCWIGLSASGWLL